LNTHIESKKIEMAEFDTSGFKAVDKFFSGSGGDDHDDDDVVVKGNKSSMNSIQGKRRGGVGAIKQSSSQSNTNLTNQVLKVGKKRNRDNQQGDVDDDDDDGEGDNDSTEDDDDLNIGRTAIAKGSSQKKIANESDSYQQSTSSKKKNKRKPGKKERQLQQQQEHQEQEEQTIESTGPEGAPEKLFDHTAVTKDQQKSGTAETNTNTRRKRRKVRSKQKNIRKDNRSISEKPSYLIPGNPGYKGRPITQATKEKLGLESSGKWNLLDTNSVKKKLARKEPQERSTAFATEEEDLSGPLFVIDRGEPIN
jgi:hypothetical protein